MRKKHQQRGETLHVTYQAIKKDLINRNKQDILFIRYKIQDTRYKDTRDKDTRDKRQDTRIQFFIFSIFVKFLFLIICVNLFNLCNQRSIFVH